MNTSINFKQSLIAHAQLLFKLLVSLKHRLLTFIVNGVAFLCMTILFITAVVLFNNHHLHISVTLDQEKLMNIDLRKNSP